MKRSAPIFLLLLAVACGDKRTSTTPTVGPITESVYASGKVKARDQYTVYPVVNGIVTDVFVLEGDTVRAGHPLFRIDDRTTALSRENAELSVGLLERNASPDSPVLAQLKANVGATRVKLENDSSLYAKQKRLWEQQIGSENDLEQRRLAYETSRENHLSARKAYQEALTRLRNELAIARNNLAINDRALDDRTVRSLIDGRVYDVMIERGELATTQRGLAVVGRSADFLLEVEVDEYDIVRVREGQRALVTMDAYGDTLMEAVVQRIDPIMDERSRTFTVEATFVDPPALLFPNLTCEANIVVRTKDQALTIPASYLADGDEVLVGRNERRKVRVGLRDLERVEVLEGLDSTATIYQP